MVFVVSGVFMHKILSFVFLNSITVFIFLLIYSIGVIVAYLYYNTNVRRLPLQEALKNYKKILRFIFCYKYPKLELQDFGTMKKLMTKISVPYSQLNLFWMDEMHIHLKNVYYESGIRSDITFELKELILRKNNVEFLYDTKTKNIIKTKGKTLFILNEKEYECNVDTDQKRIIAKCSGYYILNDSKIILKSKFRQGEIFSIEIDSSNFYDNNETYNILDIINVCNIMCKLSIIISCFIIAFICFIINPSIILSAVFIAFWLYRRLYSMVARILDVLKNLKYI